ncbi:mCG144825, partial [Mus musculus]
YLTEFIYVLAILSLWQCAAVAGSPEQLILSYPTPMLPGSSTLLVNRPGYRTLCFLEIPVTILNCLPTIYIWITKNVRGMYFSSHI